MSWLNEVTRGQRQMYGPRMIKQLTTSMYNTNSLGRGRHHVNAKFDMYSSVVNYLHCTRAEEERAG